MALVSKDVPLRIKASVLGIMAEEYRSQLPREAGWGGMLEVDVTTEQVSALHQDGRLPHINDPVDDAPVHAGIVLHGPNSTALGRKLPDGSVERVRQDREVFGIRGRSAEQRVALDLLMDESIGIVSLGGRAGTGKSALALSAGLELVLERRVYEKVMVFRPVYAVGGQELGYLPGTADEKMQPWGQAVFDVLSSVASKYVIEELMARR